MKDRSLKEINEEFDDFIFAMDDALEYLIDYVKSLNQQFFLPLDYSLSSLDKIERVYVGILEGRYEIQIDLDLMRTRIVRYLGEVFVKNINGNWKLVVDTKDLDYGIPGIGDINGLDSDYIWSPYRIVKNFESHREKGTFKTSVESHLDLL